MDNMGNFNNNSYTYFIASQFNLLTQTGQVKITYGESYDIKPTYNRIKHPQRLNHREWTGSAGSFGHPGLYTDGIDWDDSTEGESISSEVFDYIYRIPGKGASTNSLKKHTLYRIELYYDIREIIPLKYPLFYISRNIYGNVSFKEFWFADYEGKENVIKKDPDNEKVRYSFVDHFLAFGLFPEFYIIGFYGIERQRFDLPESIHKSTYNMVEEGYGNYDMKNIGYGIGCDWFFKGNMQMFFKIRWFEHIDEYRPEFNFSGHKINLEFRTYFTYG